MSAWTRREANYVASVLASFGVDDKDTTVSSLRAILSFWRGFLGLDDEGWVRPISDAEGEDVFWAKVESGKATERDLPGFVKLENGRERAIFAIAYALGYKAGEEA